MLLGQKVCVLHPSFCVLNTDAVLSWCVLDKHFVLCTDSMEPLLFNLHCVPVTKMLARTVFLFDIVGNKNSFQCNLLYWKLNLCPLLALLEPTFTEQWAHFIIRSGFVPCISLACEDALHESLWRHPFHRQHGTATFPIIAGSTKGEKRNVYYLLWIGMEDYSSINKSPASASCGIILCVLLCALPDLEYWPVNVSCHAKVSNFGYSVWARAGKQAVSRRNVPERRTASIT